MQISQPPMVRIGKFQCLSHRAFPEFSKTHPTLICRSIVQTSRSLQSNRPCYLIALVVIVPLVTALCTCLCPVYWALSMCPAHLLILRGHRGDQREESQPIYILQRYTATKHRPGTFHNQTANIKSSNATLNTKVEVTTQIHPPLSSW